LEGSVEGLRGPIKLIGLNWQGYPENSPEHLAATRRDLRSKGGLEGEAEGREYEAKLAEEAAMKALDEAAVAKQLAVSARAAADAEKEAVARAKEEEQKRRYAAAMEARQNVISDAEKAAQLRAADEVSSEVQKVPERSATSDASHDGSSANEASSGSAGVVPDRPRQEAGMIEAAVRKQPQGLRAQLPGASNRTEVIAIARADDTKQVVIDPEEGTTITVPDIKIPGGVEWSASQTDHGVSFIKFTNAGRTATTLWDGPHTIGAGQWYIITAPERVLLVLRDQLGAGNVDKFIHALRASTVLRTWARDKGYRVKRNQNGDIVGVYAPITICGNNSLDMDGEDPESAPTLPEMEPL
jgi:hypothetical protein